MAALTVVVWGFAAPALASSLVTLETPRVAVEAMRIPGSEVLCWGTAEIGIPLKRPADVSVRLDGRLMLSGMDGGETLSEGPGRVLDRGGHRIALHGNDLSERQLDLGVRVPFALD